MKQLLVILLALVLAGCASVSMTKTGEDVTWSSRTLWKDIQGVEASAASPAGDFNFGLGSSTSQLTPEQVQAFACILNPQACKQ